jgi:hypothetical protein
MGRFHNMLRRMNFIGANEDTTAKTDEQEIGYKQSKNDSRITPTNYEVVKKKSVRRKHAKKVQPVTTTMLTTKQSKAVIAKTQRLSVCHNCSCRNQLFTERRNTTLKTISSRSRREPGETAAAALDVTTPT